MPDGRRGRRRDPDDGRARRAGDRRRRRVRLRARGRARRGPATRPTRVLRESRPTAVNLALGARRDAATIRRPSTRARSTRDEVERCRRMAAHAAELLAPGTRALTHCNAGGLATGGYGSAVGALLAAWERGLLEHVWVDETRPLLQGARLTAWELETAGIPHAVIADSAAASLMARGEVDCVITGADRIAANGDTANKIGTYALAVLARHHGIPLYVVAPSSTVDLATADGGGDPDRGARPGRGDRRASPRAIPAFDVTPADADHGDRHRAGRPPRAVRELARRGGGRAHEGDRPRRRLRDAAASADRHVGEGAAAGRRPADDRLDRRRASQTRRRGRRGARRHERAQGARVRRAGRRAARSPSTTTARDSNEDRLGAIGDMQFVIERAGLDDDLLVIAGDNLFEFDLAGVRRASGASKGDGERDRRARRRHASSSRSATAIVELDEDGRVVDFDEKPEDPPATLAATATYLYHRAHVAARPQRISTRGTPRPARPVRRLAAPARARLRLARSTRAGTTSATTSSCSRRTTASVASSGLPERARLQPRRSHTFGTEA